ISTACGSSSDTVTISFASQLIACGSPITDARDGNTYNTVLIGTQCWMAENLAYLPSVYPSDSGSMTTPYYYVYGYEGTDVSAAKATSNYQTYGVLYNWPAAMNSEASSDSVPSGVQGICPSGWYLPSDEEWKILEGEVDSQYGYPDPEWDGTGWRGLDAARNLKETGTTHWFAPNTGTNNSGFTALPGSFLNPNSYYNYLGYRAIFWSSTEYNSSQVWRRYLYQDYGIVSRLSYEKKYGYSVRCIKDSIPPCSPQPTHANAGPDSLNITGDSITLMANTPIDGQGLWTILSGTGGVIADTADPTSTFTGLAGSSYELSWTISTACGSSSDTVTISFASQLIACGSPITDARDGNTYNTVHIGTQCWMAENLAYLPAVSPSSVGSNTNPYYYVYDYQGTDVSAAKATSNYQTYGVLYNWPAAISGATSSDSVPSGVQGACPAGWYLPSDEEWKILEGEVDSQYGYPDPLWNGTGWRGNDAGGNLKETGTTNWNSPNTGATNSSFFTARPGGLRFGNGNFIEIDGYGYWWSATEYNTINAWYRQLGYNYSSVGRPNYNKYVGFSVRCLMDSIPICSPQPTQANAGPDSLNIAGDSITLMANTPVDGQGLWTILSGTGGVIADTTNPSSTFYGLAANTYELSWTISTACGSSSDTVQIGFASQGTSCGNPITDARDGNTYNTVLIGT
ncbi:MAG: hypothetical protein GY746_07575, partial [Gammaproteobacteria bacterium]|nr:hypothetical protein [Gammaproteobacteria bacterium]